MSTWQPATGRQLWALNERGLLPLALRRSSGQTVDKATAWTLLADWHQLAGECPGQCEWPLSCAREDACWLAEHAAYIGSPNGNGDGAQLGPADCYDRKTWESNRSRVL